MAKGAFSWALDAQRKQQPPTHVHKTTHISLLEVLLGTEEMQIH